MTMHEIILYLSLSIPWCVAGFFGGFVTGWRARLWSREMPTVLETETPSKNPETEPRDRPWYRSSQAWIGAGVAAIGLFTGVSWYVSGQETAALAVENQRLVECQRIWSDGFSTALDRRTAESQRVTEGQDRLWLLFQEALNTAPSPELRERFRVQLDAYLDARAKTKQAQIENPYPAPPKDVCR